MFESVNIDRNSNFEERESLLKFFKDFANVFHLKGDKLSYTTALKHSIPIRINTNAINTKMYRLPQAHKDVVNYEIKDFLKMILLCTVRVHGIHLYWLF